MKKAIALVLVTVMAVLLTACGEDKEITQTTSIIPVDTQIFQSTDAAVSVQESQNSSSNPTGATMILTSKAGETMPTIVTTKFNPANEKTETAVYIPDNFTTGNMVAPPTVTSIIATTPKPTTATAHTEPTEPKSDGSDDGKTDTAGKKTKALSYTSFELSASNNVTIEFDAAGWNGGVKSGKFTAQVKTDDGNTNSVTGRVVGLQTSEGYFSVVIPVGDIVTDEVNSLNITIPAGAVTSRKDDQISKTYTATIAVK